MGESFLTPTQGDTASLRLINQFSVWLDSHDFSYQNRQRTSLNSMWHS